MGLTQEWIGSKSVLTQESLAAAQRLLAAGVPRAEICARQGLTMSTLKNIARGRYPKRLGGKGTGA